MRSIVSSVPSTRWRRNGRTASAASWVTGLKGTEKSIVARTALAKPGYGTFLTERPRLESCAPSDGIQVKRFLRCSLYCDTLATQSTLLGVY